MKFDKYGRYVQKGQKSVEVCNAISSKVMQQLQNLGIKIGNVATFVEMVPEESTVEALEIIGKLARLQK